MSVKKVNVLTIEPDEPLDEAGFRHLAATVNDRLAAARIGASVYEAEPGVPIWPYHYHHGIEEWLYVIAGAPVLREPAGERVLSPGDLVCFPSGPLGAHTAKGPGRFAIVATGQYDEPYLSVYPDSDKVSGPEGIHLRSSAVGYWHGEGTAVASEPVERPRPPETPPPRPVVNVLAADGPAELGSLLGSERLDGRVIELGPGDGSEPYHYVDGRERWLLVLAGTPTLRHPEGEEPLEAGDLVCLPEGPAGAHRLLARSGSAARALLLSTTGLPANVCYPDTGHWVIRNGPGGQDVVLRRAMRRVAVVGTSGAGKSWLASRLAAALGVPHVELDAIHHGPGWVPAPAEEMRRQLDARCPPDGAWVADGNYASKGGDVIRARADTVVWLDLPRGVVMRRLVRRTLRRAVLRERLWNGNRESLRDVLARDPDRSVLRWAWTRHAPQRAAYAAQADARWVRLSSPADVRRFLAANGAGR